MPRVSKKALTERATEVSRLLAEEYPGSAAELCALRHSEPFELLVATILSAQCTDERVNMVTPALFARYPDAPALAGADPAEVEELIKSTGFFRSKTKSLLGMSAALVERYGGEVPEAMEDLTTLPGVGRKTANVVRSVALGLPGLPVDTHVGRLARRLRLSASSDPVKIESELCAMLPAESWGAMSLRLILHGRRVCQSRMPRCGECILAGVCPSAGAFSPNKPARPARKAAATPVSRRAPAPPARRRKGATSA